MGNSQTKYSISTEGGKYKMIAERALANNTQDPSTITSNESKMYPDFLIKLSKVLEDKAKEENLDGIREKVFEKYITPECPALGKKLFKFILVKEGLDTNEDKEGLDTNEETKALSKEIFLHHSFYILNLLTDSQQLEFYIKVFANNRDEMSANEFSDFVLAAYTIAQFASSSTCLPDSVLSAVGRAAMHGKETTSCKYIINWLSQHCPRIVVWMHRHLNHILTVGYSTLPQNVSAEEDDDVTPVLDDLRSLSLASTHPTHPALIWLLSSSLPNLYTRSLSPSRASEDSVASLNNPHNFIKELIKASQPSHWIQLYDSNEHGLSVNRLKHHVFDYHGPTLLFVSADMDNTMFCLASDEDWRDSKHFYGGLDAICFQIYPEYKIIEKGEKMVYFNISSRGFPTGLQVGTDSTNRALCIDIQFDLVHYRKIPYKLKSLEVWGCGTTEAKDKQAEFKKLVAKDAEKRRKVPMSAAWKDNPDRYLIEMAGKRPNYARYEQETQNHSSVQ